MLYTRVTFAKVTVGALAYWQAQLDNGYCVTATQGFARRADCQAAARRKAESFGRVPMFMN